MKNIFDESVTNQLIERINQLTPETKAQWGEMSVSQMLSHCSAPYEQLFKPEEKKAGFLFRLMMKMFVKSTVVGNRPYKKNTRTAPGFLRTDTYDFNEEKAKLIENIKKVVELGESYFADKESYSFGKLSVAEWNNLFYKHLDHHLKQFGV